MKYKNDYQNRVVEEKLQLDIKIKALGDFCNTPIFNSLPAEEFRMLNEQFVIMEALSTILGDRIAAFK